MFLQVTMLAAEIFFHTGTKLLPQAFYSPTENSFLGLKEISYLLLEWLTIHQPLASCWRLWNQTICTIFTSLDKGHLLHHSLGPWTEAYQQHCFWIWQLLANGRLLQQLGLDSFTCAAILVTENHWSITFSTTVPTNQQFHAPGDSI